MSLVGFFKRHKNEGSRITSLVASVSRYMLSENSNDEFFPAIVAAALRETELSVLAAFGELDDLGIVKPVYLTYCAIHAVPLDEFATRDSITDPEYCGAGDHEVFFEDDTMRFDVAFRVNREALKKYTRVAA